MERKLGDIITIDFIITNFSTGAAVDADSIPICQIFQDDTDTPLIEPIVMKRGANTGNYRVSIPATTENGFSVGKSYSVVITAIVSGVSRKLVASMFVLNGIRTDLGANFISVDTTIGITRIFIYSSNLENLITVGDSDQNGDATFILLDGTYSVFATKVGYSFETNPISIDTSVDSTIQFTPVYVATPSPQPAETCRVYAFCVKADGITPMPAITAKAQITHLPFAWDDTAMITGEDVAGIYDSTTGMVYWDLIQGATALFQIKEVGLKVKKLIPNTSSAHL